MRSEGLTETLDLALQASGCDQLHAVHKPRLLSDNGSSYVSSDLAEWLQGKGMKHSLGAPYQHFRILSFLRSLGLLNRMSDLQTVARRSIWPWIRTLQH